MTASSEERGTSSAISSWRRWPWSMIEISGRRPGLEPTRKFATSSIGFCVADSPMRTTGASATCCSRSSDSARCAPRRVPMTAWISSTMTVRTVRSIARLRSAVSSKYSDSGVVTRTCGGVRSIAARSDCVVSPVRTAAVIRGGSSAIASATRRMPRRGSARFLWMSALRAFSGETYSTRTSSGSGARSPSWTRSSSTVRNAASVLPEPVGAAISVC